MIKKDYELKYNKSRIALFQLIDAVELYYEKRYVSAITLAGAAEEIFGKLSDEQNGLLSNIPLKKNHLDDYLNCTLDVDIYRNSEGSGNKPNMNLKAPKPSQSELRDHRNYVRNALKHKSPEEDKIKANFRLKAVQHIAGAIINYGYLNGNIPENEVIIKFCGEIGITFS